jgi:hypothetical protein
LTLCYHQHRLQRRSVDLILLSVVAPYRRFDQVHRFLDGNPGIMESLFRSVIGSG